MSAARRAAFRERGRGAVLILALLALCAAASPARAAHGTLVIGLSQFPSTLHPDINPEAVKSYALSLALRPVTAFDKDWKNTCLLCTELPSLENGLARLEGLPGGGQGMAVTLRLRPDLVWGDGEPVTARDLAFTWKVGRDPASGFATPDAWSRVRAVDVVDDHTAVMHLDRPRVDFDRWGGLLPEHIEGPRHAAAKPGDYLNQTAYDRDPLNPGLYNGPYLLAEFAPGERMVFRANPRWTGPKPAIPAIAFRAIGNSAALQANLLSGDVDLSPPVGLTVDQVISLQRQAPDRYDYVFRPSLTWDQITLQLDNPVLKDVRVRRALLHAIDRRTISDKLFGGKAIIADSWVNPLDPMHTEGVATTPYDPARARALLDAAGWTPGPDGVRRDAEGRRLSVELTAGTGIRVRELEEQVLQSAWKAVGVEAVIRNEPPRTLFGETLKRRRFQGAAMFSWISSLSIPPRQTLATESIPRPANSWGGSNYGGFSDPRMDGLIARAESELDPAKARGIWAEMQRIFAEELPMLPLFFQAEATVLPKWLHGYAPTGHVDPPTLWAEAWKAE